MEEIGKTEILTWDVFYGNLIELNQLDKLR
jgi:hypothetical protein